MIIILPEMKGKKRCSGGSFLFDDFVLCFGFLGHFARMRTSSEEVQDAKEKQNLLLLYVECPR